VYVTALAGDIQPLVGLAWESRHYRSVEFAVANPCDVESNHAQYLRPARALNAAGARYVRGDPADLIRRILAS
jgi:3-deoxy-D-arabino-heptulosonate 7-phosphate (DAHP) synthase